MTKIVEVLYADSGGGHRSVAQAICMAIQATGADCTVRLVNAVEISREPFHQFSVQYPFMIRHAAWLYRFLYFVTDHYAFSRAMENFLGVIFGKEIKQYLASTDADLLISCHTLVNLLVVQRVPSKLKYACIVADPFSPHAESFSPEVDLCVVASDAARALALRQRVPPEKVRVVGHPVPPGYLFAAREKCATLKQLGLDDSRLTVLVTGGGDGLGKLSAVIASLDASDLAVQLIIVCGHNEKLYMQLKRRNFRLPVSLLPFTDEMPSLLCAADLLLAKAGPSTLFEAFQAGLPILLFDAIMGQEAGNVDYVCKNGAGLFCESPRTVVHAISALMREPSLREQMSARSRSLANPNAALDAARACLSLLE